MMNIGGPELLIVLALLSFGAVAVAAVVLMARGGGGRGSTRHHSALVSDASPSAFLDRAAGAVAGLDSHTMSSVGISTLVVTHTYIAGWRILIAILLFPLGLIALIGRDQATAVVAAAPEGGHVRVTMDGVFTPALIDRINSTLN